ncbi:MAG: CPBP family glutamic-type intramembrane protease [Desulfobacterales bacterium]|nr:CPBP family glutamic-type intramembrane protease [Desulfobacterales bacterium]
MHTQFSSLKSYDNYLKCCSIRELRQIVEDIDPDKYPDRAGLARERLREAMAAQQPNLFEDVSLKTLLVPADPRDSGISYLYLVIPVSAFILYYFAGQFLAQWEMITFRPWLLMPVVIAMTVLFDGGMLAFAMRAARKFKFRPFLKPITPSGALRDFFISFLLVIPVNIGITIVVLILTAVIDAPVKTHSLIQYISYAPNSWTVIFWLVAIFTILPVVEEVFFRGFIYNMLKTKVSVGLACIIQAFLFAVCHPYGIAGNVGIFILGLVLAVVYEKKGCLLSPVFIHCIKNGLVAAPFLITAVFNLHSPAVSRDDALNRPEWLLNSPPEYVEQKETGQAQFDYAKETWGSRGNKLWKKEANAFMAIPLWFPEDELSSGKAELGLASIYFYKLGDYWRTIVTAERVIKSYGKNRELSGQALSLQAWSYYMLKRFDTSRRLFRQVVSEYPENQALTDSAEEGLKRLEVIAPER